MAKKRGSKRNKHELGDSWVNATSSESDEGEDVSQVEEESPRATTTSSSPKLRNSLKNRDQGSSGRAVPEFIMPLVHEPPSRPKSSPKQKSITPKKRRTVIETSNAENDYKFVHLASNSLWWLLDILVGALVKLKGPLTWLLAGWLFLGLLIVIRNLLFISVWNAVSPICRLPGVSLLDLSICRVTDGTQFATNDVHFDKVVDSQTRFEHILEKTAEGVGIPADMKHSEASMRDLRSLVKHSQIKSRHEMELELTGYIDTATQAAFDLQRFDSRVGRAVDKVLSTTRWTQRVLESVEDKKGEQGAIAAFIGNTLLYPFQPLWNSESSLIEQYMVHMRVVKGEIDTLLTEATALLGILGNLEDRLEVINDIAVRDSLSASGQRDELLARLWTILGGNKAKLGGINAQIKILSQVNNYRRTAVAKVIAIIAELRKMDTELEQLRESVGSVEAEHRSGTPLLMHIESIQLGATRLEDRRNHQRGLEKDHQRAVLEGSRKFEGMDKAVSEIGQK